MRSRAFRPCRCHCNLLHYGSVHLCHRMQQLLLAVLRALAGCSWPHEFGPPFKSGSMADFLLGGLGKAGRSSASQFWLWPLTAATSSESALLVSARRFAAFASCNVRCRASWRQRKARCAGLRVILEESAPHRVISKDRCAHGKPILLAALSSPGQIEIGQIATKVCGVKFRPALLARVRGHRSRCHRMRLSSARTLHCGWACKQNNET